MKNNSSSDSFPFFSLQWGSHNVNVGTIISLLAPMETVLFLLVLVYLIYFRLKTPKRKTPLPPGPTPWPIVGNIPELLRNKPTFKWIHKLMLEMNTDIACIKLGSIHIIPVKCPIIAREFLKKQDAIFSSRPITMGTEYSSRGFLTAILSPLGDQSKKMRKVVASEVVSPARMQRMLVKRNQEADNLVWYVYNLCVSSGKNITIEDCGAVVNVRVITRAFVGDVIRTLMFNKRYFSRERSDGSPGAEEEEYVEAIFTVLKFIYAFAISDYMPSMRRFDLDGHEKIIKAAIRVLNKFHDGIIDDRIKERREGENAFKFCEKEPEDIVDMFISLKDVQGKPLLSADEIKAQCIELLMASVDNPSNAVEWALAEMIKNPEILAKAVEEIDMVVGRDRLVQESDFPKLHYLRACARESLRLHPVFPFNVPHVSIADTIVAGYFIPKGSHLLLSRVELGRNPNVWEDPLKFNPERHFDKNASQINLKEPELRFISFSTGRRGCVGEPLGSSMTIMLLSRLLQGFKWSTPPGESEIDLSESTHSLFLAKPLKAHATIRLASQLYQGK